MKDKLIDFGELIDWLVMLLVFVVVLELWKGLVVWVNSLIRRGKK